MNLPKAGTLATPLALETPWSKSIPLDEERFVRKLVPTFGDIFKNTRLSLEHGPPGFTDPKTNPKKQPIITLRNLKTDFDEEADIVPTLEEQTMLKKLRAEKIAKEKGKLKESDEADQAKAKKQEVGVLKLKVIKLRREELELEEKALKTLLEETERAKSSRKEKRVHVKEDESTDSDSNHRRLRTKIALNSDSNQEEEEDMS
ncbi:hypothetical protein AgCh_038217 [Apium graveolens]